MPLELATAAEGLYGNANREETGAQRLLPPPWEAGGDGAFKGEGSQSYCGNYRLLNGL